MNGFSMFRGGLKIIVKILQNEIKTLGSNRGAAHLGIGSVHPLPFQSVSLLLQ